MAATPRGDQSENDRLSSGESRSMPPVKQAVNASDCRRILIVGAGGFGREVFHWLKDALSGDSSKITGFLSVDSHQLEGFSCPLPILGDPSSFIPEPTDGLVLAIGVPEVRRRVAETLVGVGAHFLTVIHPTAIVADTARIATGAIISPFCIVSDAAYVGEFVLMNYHSSLGHDSSAGDFAVLSPYATLGGGAHIAEDVFLGLHASVGPGKSVGARSKVSANSWVLATAPCDSIIYGVPGRIGRRVVLDPKISA